MPESIDDKMVQIQNADECKKELLQFTAYRWITVQPRSKTIRWGNFFDTIKTKYMKKLTLFHNLVFFIS